MNDTSGTMCETPAYQYWSKRKDSIYLYAAREICRKYGKKSNSVLDVGSNGTPTLEWHRESATRLVSLDLRKPYVGDGVQSLTMDFLNFNPNEQFDLVTCFQVLEHVPDVEAFSRKLLEVSRTLIVSVPYKWKAGACKYHIHDPVTNKKMEEWFGVKPVFIYLAVELNKQQRVIHVYKNNSKVRV